MKIYEVYHRDEDGDSLEFLTLSESKAYDFARAYNHFCEERDDNGNFEPFADVMYVNEIDSDEVDEAAADKAIARYTVIQRVNYTTDKDGKVEWYDSTTMPYTKPFFNDIIRMSDGYGGEFYFDLSVHVDEKTIEDMLAKGIAKWKAEAWDDDIYCWEDYK